MAQDYVTVLRSIWSDPDWRALPSDAQHAYLLLLSHPDRNSAGVLPLTIKKWTRLAHGLTVAGLTASLEVLDDAGFIVLDEDSEELLVRSYIRRATVYKHIRLLVGALREVAEVESGRLRSALGQELVRLPRLLVPAHNERMAEEARTAQQRLDELASMMCDAPPDPPGDRAGQDAADPMPHGMADGMGHGGSGGMAPRVRAREGVGAGVVAGVGAGAAPTPAGDHTTNRPRSNAHASTRPDLRVVGPQRCLVHLDPDVISCRGCASDRKGRQDDAS